MPNDSTDSSSSENRGALFHRGHTAIFRIVLVGVAMLFGAAAVAAFGYYHSPYWTRQDIAEPQPILFSHRHHAGKLGIDCRFCHSTVETSAFAGMPSTETCLNCHSQVFADTAMLQPVIQSAATGQPLRWTPVTRLPDHVYFNHSIHLAKGVGCTSCHGDLGRMALTAKAHPLDMRECLDCHRDPAPHLTSPDHLFASVAAPPGDTNAADVSAQALHVQHLTNCSTCHH